LWWYTPGGLIEGNEQGPFPWLVGKSDCIELQGVGTPGPGRKGDASELEFMGRSCELDFHVAKPWGNVDPYDVLVEMGRWFWKVQVKRAILAKDGTYQCKSKGYKGCYTKEEIDFIAAHLAALDIWYIVPVEALAGRKTLYFNPCGNGRYEKYREAWCLLACTEKARGWEDVPVLCRCRELPVRCGVPEAGMIRDRRTNAPLSLRTGSRAHECVRPYMMVVAEVGGLLYALLARALPSTCTGDSSRNTLSSCSAESRPSGNEP
jgi:hypothetical protein